jgi:alpha-D-ribose 1-methylphosphonate 5-triphosphate diphosphatase PhnM
MWAQGIALAADFENSVYVECKKNELKFQQLLASETDARTIELVSTLGIESRSLEFNNSVLAEIFLLQQKNSEGLPELFRRISADAAKFLGMDNRFGSFEKGKQPGVNLITGVDFKHMKLSSRSKVTRLL